MVCLRNNSFEKNYHYCGHCNEERKLHGENIFIEVSYMMFVALKPGVIFRPTLATQFHGIQVITGKLSYRIKNGLTETVCLFTLK